MRMHLNKGARLSWGSRCRYGLQAAPLYLLFGFFAMLPVATASRVGGWLARQMGWLWRGRGRLADQQLQMVMPELNALQRQAIVRGMWDNLGRVVAELAHLKQLAGQLQQRIPITGLDGLQDLAAGGKPILFVSGHLGNWELSPLMAQLVGINPYRIYRAANNPWLERLIRRQRDASSNLGVPSANWQNYGIPKGPAGSKQLLARLRGGHSLAMLVDQRMNDGVAVPFLGHPAMTADAVTKLAVKFGLPIVMARIVRQLDGSLQGEILPAIWPDPQVLAQSPGAASLELLGRINQQLGDWVRQHPAQWLWLHRRW